MSRASGLRILLLLGAVIFLVGTPILCLLVTSFDVSAPGKPYNFGWENWKSVIEQPDMAVALANTISLGIVRQMIALVLGSILAWLIARTDLPGRKIFEVGFWIALFMPQLPGTLAWILLLDGSTGLINHALYVFPFVKAPVFKIYSWWGIVWVHIMGATLAVKVFLLVPVFRALDGTLEEASRASGAGLMRTFTRIILPMMAPALMVTTLIGLVRSMQAFEVELVIGAPVSIQVYSTMIYQAMAYEPPREGLASAMSIAFLLMLVPFVLVQQWYAHVSAHGSVTGKIRVRTQALGRLKWPAFCFVALLISLMTLVPLACLLMATFMRMFGIFDMPEPWTLDNWRFALGHGDVPRSLWNTLRLGLSASVFAMILFSALSYVIVRSRARTAQLLDFATWLPALIPGVVLSLGLFQMFAGIPLFRIFYGSVTSLVVAVMLGTVTVGVQFLKTSMRQLGRELEEAGWACGGRPIYVLRRIVVPLIAPSIAVVGLETFAAANAAVGVISLLGTGPNQPLSILQLNLLTSGQFEAACVVGFTISSLTIISALLARFVAERTGLRTAT